MPNKITIVFTTNQDKTIKACMAAVCKAARTVGTYEKGSNGVYELVLENVRSRSCMDDLLKTFVIRYVVESNGENFSSFSALWAHRDAQRHAGDRKLQKFSRDEQRMLRGEKRSWRHAHYPKSGYSD